MRYFVARVLLMLPTILLVGTFAFVLVRLMPGDVALQQLASSPTYSQSDVKTLRHQLGIDTPLWKAYPKWVSRVVVGDLGKSLWSKRTVASLILSRASVTLELAILAFLFANIIGTIFGILSAVYQNTFLDYVVRLLSIGGLSLPNFWIATLVIVFGARELHYLPPLTQVSIKDNFAKNLQQFTIPAAIIAISSSSLIMRLFRSSLLEVLRLDFIRTARAKGLSGRRVIVQHALRNALLPVITLQALQFAFLLTGSVIIEVIFNLSGVGRLLYDGIVNRDYTLVQGLVLVYGLIFVAVNLAVDFLYAVIDPRVSY